METVTDTTNETETSPPVEAPKKPKKPKRLLKFFIVFFCVLLVLTAAWTLFSLIGRINAAYIIPDITNLRISIANPVNLIDGILEHESLEEIISLPSFATAAPIINLAKENPLFKNKLLRFAARGNVEAALLTGDQGVFAAAWDMGFVSPLLRILPTISGFVNVPNLYYVNAGKHSRFEYRLGEMTIYIGPHKNLLFITDSRSVFESRAVLHSGHEAAFSSIKPSDYNAALVLSNDYIISLLADMDAGMAAILENIDFDSKVEAGLSVFPRKIEFHLAAPLSSRQPNLSNILSQRAGVPGMAEQIPADAQYATILSAGTLDELYQTARAFNPGLDDTLKIAETACRLLMGLTLNDLLFSWTGNEFAAFGIEGRPHPVYAIQISNEKKREEVFNKAFRSIVLNEDVRLNLDGTRIPRIMLPDFLQSLLRRWNIFLPSPYYIIYKDYLLASESAEALLSALRAMQRNDVLPKTAQWRNIAGGKTTASAFSVYYSLDLQVPFFLRNSTAFSDFISLYRQGLTRMNINRGVVELTLTLVPGSGSGVTLLNGYPLDIGSKPSNRVYGGESGFVFYSSGNTACSLDLSNNKIYEFTGQGSHWVISTDIKNNANHAAWIVTDRGRVTLVDNFMEPDTRFPVLTGLRISSPPAAFNGKLYLCDENGGVHTVDTGGVLNNWETSFIAAVRSPPSFLTVSSRSNAASYAAVYPKSFFGEIWLLDIDGKALPNWPASISITDENDENFGIGVGFGSPLLFSHNNRVMIAFINQSGQLLVYDQNAEIVSPFPVTLEGIFYQQPVYDGQYLWLVSSEGYFFRVDMHGDVFSQRIQNFSVMEEGYITVFDYDKDKTPEIFLTGEGNALYGFTHNFRSLESFPLSLWGKPLFIPAQGNKKAEIIGIGMSNRLYRYQFK